MGGPDLAHRRILYGRRGGHRLKATRQAALDDLLPRFAIPATGGSRLDPARLFLRPMRAFWLEIGFGNGEHLADQAARHADVGCIGCEPFVNGVSMLLRHLGERGLDNVRVHSDDARPLIEALPDGSLERVYLLFPDPWPKTRHHRRRFIARETLDELARVMRPGADLRIATDHMECGRWMLHHALQHAAFDWPAERAADWRRRPENEAPTRYEEKALAAGRPCLYLSFRRR